MIPVVAVPPASNHVEKCRLFVPAHSLASSEARPVVGFPPEATVETKALDCWLVWQAEIPTYSSTQTEVPLMYSPAPAVASEDRTIRLLPGDTLAIVAGSLGGYTEGLAGSEGLSLTRRTLSPASNLAASTASVALE